MAKYVLSTNEYIILKKENVSFPNNSDSISELLLTNENIVVSTSGVFYSKNRMLPVRQIKRFKDRAQIVLTNIRNEKVQLDVFLKNNERVSFIFSEENPENKNLKMETIKWINEINRLVTGESINTDYENELFGFFKEFETSAKKSIGKAIIGTKIFAEILKGTVDTVKDVFEVNDKSNNDTKSENNNREYFSGKCSSCGAPISGRIGSLVKCKYCETSVELKGEI